MAYLGKEFKFEKEENFENFVKVIAAVASEAANYLNYKPNIKLTKTGDNYTISYVTTDTTRDVTFTPGVKFHETIKEGIEADTVFTVSGDTVTQVQDFGSKGSVTFKRTFSDNELVIEMSCSTWDGVARRHYKA